MKGMVYSWWKEQFCATDSGLRSAWTLTQTCSFEVEYILDKWFIDWNLWRDQLPLLFRASME